MTEKQTRQKFSKEYKLDVIGNLYPEDEATGFEVGELRGIWSITFPEGYFNSMSDNSSVVLTSTKITMGQ